MISGKRYYLPRQWRRRLHENVLAYWPRGSTASDENLTIVMPLAVKDIFKAERAILSLRRHLLHPIDAIVVVGQPYHEIVKFCQQQQVTYLDETKVLPSFLQAGAVLENGLSPNGWLRQQFLKLLAFSYVEADRILVFDADTFLVRDLALFTGTQQILFLADEYTKSYEELMHILLGPIIRHPRSFVAHFMVFQRDIVRALQEHISKQTGLNWMEAIVTHMHPRIVGTLSEYELYGNFVYNFFPKRAKTSYWYNRKIHPDNKDSLEKLEKLYSKYNSISAHVH